MACYNHPYNEAVANCSVCGKPVCSECHVEIGGNSYCVDCINSLINSKSSGNNRGSQPMDTIEPIVVDDSVRSQSVDTIEPVVDDSVRSQSVDTIEPVVDDSVRSQVIENIEPVVDDSVRSQVIENIEPITQPKTVPFADDNSNNYVENPNAIPNVEKPLENYQPEYDYEPQYVESYGDADIEEDSYYENPEVMPEPQEEYQVVKEQIIRELNSSEVYSEQVQNDENMNLESKYEKYLDDIYHDESPNAQYEDPVYTEPMNNQYREPVYNDSANNQYGESVYRRPMNNQYREPVYREPIYDQEYDDLEYIVPIHQNNSPNNGPSYEEIKRKLDEENYRNNNAPKYGSPKKRDEYREPVRNLDDIQRMHNEAPKEDNGFTKVEIALTIILVILIIIVGFYVIYLFALTDAYGSVFEALTGLVQNPGLFISNLIY